MTNYYQSLVAHVVATLPESISERKRVLEALLVVVAEPTLLQPIRDLLFTLNAHSVAQRELNLQLSDQAAPKPNDHDAPTPTDGPKKS